MTSVTFKGVLSERDSWSAADCSMAAALTVVGRRATMLLLREAFYGARRFDEFARRAELSEKITAARLKELVDDGLLERRPYHDAGQRSREDYHLTDKGEELLPALLALMQWGDKWVRPDGGRLRLTHDDCGERISVQIRCADDHPVTADGIGVSLRSGRRSPSAR